MQCLRGFCLAPSSCTERRLKKGKGDDEEKDTLEQLELQEEEDDDDDTFTDSSSSQTLAWRIASAAALSISSEGLLFIVTRSSLRKIRSSCIGNLY